MNSNRLPRETRTKRIWWTALAILAMLSGLLPYSLLVEPLAAQALAPEADPAPVADVAVDDRAGVESVYKAYLPMAFGQGQSGPKPPSAYAIALSQALGDCADTPLNRICYGRGSVTLTGGGPLTTPGQVATLQGVSGLTLVSPDPGHWSVALLRLAVDSPSPDLGLTLLAFGNVEIRNLMLFDPAADNGDVAPSLSFSSSPVPGQDPETGGLIVYNPGDEEPLAIGLNDADLILASSAVVQAQPGDKMTVTMVTGSALVDTAGGDEELSALRQLTVPLATTAGGDEAVVAGERLSVPLDASGKASGKPTPPVPFDDDLLAPLVPTSEDNIDDLLEPLVPTLLVDLSEELRKDIAKFRSAHRLCLQGQSRQVYRIMYYARILKKNERHLADSLKSQLDPMVRECATFELEFNSFVNLISTPASGSTHVRGQGMIIRFGLDGYLVEQAQMDLTHAAYDFTFAIPEGCYYLELTDGYLHLYDGYMRINRNRLAISTSTIASHITEHQIITCMKPPIIGNYAPWQTMFLQLYQHDLSPIGAVRFTPDHWKYTGLQKIGEAITFREAMFYDGLVTGNTWLALLHRPGS